MSYDDDGGEISNVNNSALRGEFVVKMASSLLFTSICSDGSLRITNSEKGA